ncbi:TetR family transcriptional regulator [Archangium sp.]|uniref:TetR family transcriptional regulator n=1 Tax=Archangium sp. TaxID=1872627 RepID=UPI00389B0D12
MDERRKGLEQPNLRERKQRLLRLELGEVALHLFIQRGFAETTIEDIAEAAGISRRTFFRYFEAKEDVVLWRLRYSSEQLGAALETRPADEPPLLAVRNALEVMHESYQSDPERYRAYLRFLLETPRIRAQLLDTREQWRALLARTLAARLGDARDKNGRALLIASIAVCAQDVAVRRWASEGTRSLKEYLDETFTALGELLCSTPARSAPARKRSRRRPV